MGGLVVFLMISAHVFTTFTFAGHPEDFLVFACFLAASTIMNCVSAGAHLFSCTSLTAHEILFALDWGWIGVLFISRAVGLALYQFPLQGYALIYGVLTVSCTSLCFAISIYLARHSVGIPKWVRVAVIVPAVLVMELPVFYRMITGTVSLEAVLVLVMMAGGVVLLSQHFPERVRPELFDYGFYSHPLWHTCYISANYYEVFSLLHDYCVERSLHAKLCGPHDRDGWFWWPVVGVGCLLATALLRIRLNPHSTNKHN